MSIGSWALGVLNGLTIGLLAVGLVLVYKSNRFLNLAHAQLGTLSALLVAKWVIDWHWGFWLSFVIAVAVGLVIGLVTERVLIRPLRRVSQSPVRLLLVSLGVSQILLALAYIPHLSPDPNKGAPYPQPFQSHLHIGDVSLTGMYVLTAVMVPVLVIALALFMRYTVTGMQIRAAANNPDAARLSGISIGRASAITWGVAGALAAVSAVLQAPTQTNFSVASFGPFLLMLTLGAAAVGAFVSLPGALAGGLLLGVVSQFVTARTSNGTDAELAVFALIMAIVLARGRAIARVFDLTGAVVEDPPVARVPAALRDRDLVRHRRKIVAVVAIALGLVWPLLPYFHSSANEFLLSLVLIYALIGVALTMLLGWGGQVSLGHFALVGLGAYLAARWSTHGWSLTALCLVVGAIAAAVMVVVGIPALRVRGLTLAVTTIGFAVIADDWLFRQRWLGSDQPFGLSARSPRLAPGLGTPTSQLAVYYVALAVLVLAVAAGLALRRSSPGRLMVAVRDNERASAAFGFSPATVKLGVLAVSGFLCGVAGVLWTDAWKSVSPVTFTADVSIAVIAIPVIGGLGSLGGAVAAAALLYGVTFFVGPHVSSVFGSVGQNLGFGLFLAGAGEVFVLLKFPTGLSGAAQGWWQRYLDGRAAKVEVASALAGDAMPLEVRDVVVLFGGLTALNGPDITVRTGEIVGLIGTNGAGKTTLMNVISGVIRPERGSIRLFGTEVVDLPADFRAAFGVARSFQDASLFVGLTVTETIELAIARHHKVGIASAMVRAPWVRSTERQVHADAVAIVERFGLDAWADTRTIELSTGTRRICDLAAQVAARPKLILLDEPTAGVAQRDAEAFAPLLRQVRDELDCAVLIVEHDMALLMSVCDRVYALEAGQVIAEGTPEEIRADPLVIASYLGTDETAIARSSARDRSTRSAT